MLEGEISQINLVERLVELWREQFTGAIRFENDGIIKIIYFKGGDILSASTNDRADSIDEILMRAGKVSREHVKQALAKRKESETLGDALLNLGFITRKELTWARRVQVVGVIRSIAAWTDGSFTIVADYLPKRDEGTLFPLSQILVELIVTDQDRARFEQSLDGGSVVFSKTADFEEVWRKLGLNEDAEAIVAQIDGVKSAAEVATASGRDTFNAYKLLHAFATLGILSRPGKPRVDPQLSLDDFESAGVGDAADLWTPSAPPTADAAGFSLDDAPGTSKPTLELPNVTFDEPPHVPPMTGEVPAPAAPESTWDETEDLALPPLPPEPEEESPGWNLPPEPVAPSPAVMAAPAAAREEQWGFDEAQIETARKAAAPPPRSARPPATRPAESRGRYGLLVALLVLGIVAAAGYYGWTWWQSRDVAPPAVAETRPAAPVPPVTEGTTMVPLTAGETQGTTASDTTPAVDTMATSVATPVVPAPINITPEPAAPVGSPATPAAGRESYDAMARQHLANASGNFTVQIQILCDPANLQKAMDAGGASVWFVPQPIGARSCYRVLWGRFETREEADRALTQVPAGIRDPSAAVKPVPRG